MASTKYAFDLETYRYDKQGNPVRGVSSISVFADTYEEGLAKAKATASSRSNVGGYDVFQSLAGNSKYYDSNKGKYVGVVEDSGKRGTPDSVRGVGADGSLAKLNGYSYEGEAPLAFSKDLSKEYGGLKTVNNFTSEMIANDPTNKQITQADLYAQLAKAQALLNSKTGAPTNAGQIGTPMGTPQFGSTSPSAGNVAGAFASSQSMLPSIDMKMADYERQLAKAEREQERTQKGLLDFLKKSPSQTEMREDAFQDIGVNPTEYFADQKARIAEIDSLTQAYNEQVAAKDAAIALSYDKLASNSFINNQIGQIERNAAPRLNQMSANINLKTSILQALQGNFAEARSFVSQAVEDAVADKKFQIDLFTTMYDMNQDKITRLDAKYQDALSMAFDIAKMEYQSAREDKQQMSEIILDAAQRGVDLSGYFSGSLDSLVDAYSKNVGAIELADRNDSSSESSNTFTNTQINKGANNAGVDADTFKSYPYEVQNYYISTSATQIKDINSAIDGVRTGDEDKDDVISEINNSNLSPVVKNFFTTQINSIPTAVKEPGFLSKTWTGIKNFLGI